MRFLTACVSYFVLMDRFTAQEQQLAEQHLLRSPRVFENAGTPVTVGGVVCSNFSSNDYLGLARDARLTARATEALKHFGVGAASSRAVIGTLTEHVALEAELAEWSGSEAVYVCSSGYLANCALPRVLVGRHDAIFADKLIHASLIDGCQLSGATFSRFPHNDLATLETMLETHQQTRRAGSRILIVTESVFSMDGDLAPLDALYALAERYDGELLVDEAHALGVFGPEQNGVCAAQLSEHIGSSRLHRTATMSKSFGSYGGLIFCTASLRRVLQSTARPLLYNTALPPALAAASREALAQIRTGGDRATALLSTAAWFRNALAAAGASTLQSASHIVPVLVGEAEEALQLSEWLAQRGVLAIAIREPTVPRGTARLRFSLSAAHTREELERAVALVAEGLETVAAANKTVPQQVSHG